jgi:NTE family protein
MDIAVALGGGGVRGNAHIGVLRVLEREGFHIRAIAGTSAGGMVAGAYAAGISPDELEARMSKVDQSRLYGFHLGSGPCLLGVGGIEKVLREILGDLTFEDLEMPCGVTAVNLATGREKHLQEGRLVDALMATIAIPGVFPPKEWGHYRLADGGVLNPVPVNLVHLLAPSRMPVVAVVLTPKPKPQEQFPSPILSSAPPILKPISRLRVAQAFEIFLRSVDIGMSAITELRLEIDKPEVVIRPAVEHLGILEHVNVPEVVKLGEQAAEANLTALRKAVSWRGKFSRWFSHRG